MEDQPERKPLRSFFATEAEYRAFVDKWNATKPAPKSPEWMEWAYDACTERCHFDFFEGCSVADVNTILVAALDAAPGGKLCVEDAAVATLVGLASAGGWEEWLHLPLSFLSPSQEELDEWMSDGPAT